MSEKLLKTEIQYLDIIGDIISHYKKGDVTRAKKIYEEIPEHAIIDMPYLFSLHLNLGYILTNHPILNTDGLLEEVIVEYLEERKKCNI